ncbi:MAG: cell division protein ZipA [Gammaproteobacteria bacterium]
MELLYVIFGAICLVLAWRGVSMAIAWRTRLRLKIEPVPPGPDPDITPNPELGKVRVVRRSEPFMPVASAAELPAVEPVFASPAQSPVDTPDEAGRADASLVGSGVPVWAEPVVPEIESEEPVLVTPAVAEVSVPAIVQQDLFANEPIAPPPARRGVGSRAQALYGDASSVEPVRPVVKEATSAPSLAIEQVIAIHVVSREFPFNGEDLLRAVLSYGLRFGDMSIFHRHEQPSGQGKVLFSMAKAVEPGTFDLESMTGEEVPGVSFFLGLPGVNSIVAYDIMVDTARRLATELQGDVLDENQQPLTRQLVEHYRERVQEFERRRLMSRPAGR